MTLGVQLRRRLLWPGRLLAGLAFGFGAVMALGQAPLGLWPLSLAGLCALTFLVSRASTAGGAAWLGLLAGAGYFALALSWIVEPFLIEPEIYGWMAPFSVVFLSTGLGLFWAIAAGLAVWKEPDPARRALRFALMLALVELARGYVLTGFPWALIGHVWVDTPLAQLVALIGPNGLTALTALAASLPICLRARPFVAAGAVAILGIGGLGYGLDRLAQPAPMAPEVALRLVQPNAEQHLKWNPERAALFLERQLDLTAAEPAPGKRRPDLVVWPETSVPYLLNRSEGVLGAIAVAGHGATVVVGIQRTEGAQGWNSLAVIGPDATVRAVYDKHHLVPFGEYVPFGDLAWRWFGLAAFASQTGNGYSAGSGAVVLDLGPALGRALPLICYEAVFPQDLRAAPGRADFILQITNDAWFGTLTGPWQHLAQARLRAIEQGLPLIRAANTGVSAVIDARGRVTAFLPLGKAAFLDAALPGATAPPPYARFGDGPVLWVLLAGLGLALLATRLHRQA